jgi:16S rRNA (guanine(1405)-N(7))-methyltransferase
MQAKGVTVSAPPLEPLLQAVLESPKYRTVSADLVRRIGLRELEARRNLKEAVKATKNTLHQIAGAYLDGKMRYADWLAALESRAQSGDRQQFRDCCIEIMGHHASTRERLDSLPEFYTATLAGLAPIHSLLDVACGLNPLAIPWMPLAPDARYYACDLYSDMMAFLEGLFPLSGVQGRAQVCDLAALPPTQRVEVALVLKVLPPLEQQERGAGIGLLRALQADYLLVSFPTRTLGGRNVRMAANYEAWFHKTIAAEGWETERFEFPNELCFLVRKARGRP